MERLRTKLKWNQRSELQKTAFLLMIVVAGTLGGYGLFMVGMGTTTPLVVVTSNSMVPTLQIGDLLVLQGRADTDIRVGDIIVFQDYEWNTTNPVVHRVVEIQDVDGELRFITKGDNNYGIDPFYRNSTEIVGVMIARVPQIGNISMFLRSPPGLALIAFIFIAILVIPEFVCKDEDEEAVFAKEDDESFDDSSAELE